VVDKMSTLLTPPEEHIITFDQNAQSMFIIVKGDCIVEVPDRYRTLK